MLEENFDTSIHGSLHRPLLVFGGEREMTLMFLVLVATFIFSVMSLWGLILGGVLWAIGSWALARAAAFDPQLSKVGIRALRYRKSYRSGSTPFVRLKEWK